MRSVSGARNRVVLAVSGILVLLLGVWMLIPSLDLDLARSWPQGETLFARPDDTVGVLVDNGKPWVLPVGATASVVIIIVALVLLLTQIPRRTLTSPLRLTHDDGTLLATMSPEVLERALSQRAQEVPGVTKCSVWVSGSSRHSWLQASARVSPDAEVDWTVTEIRRRLSQDAQTALGKPPEQVDLLIYPHTAAPSKATRGSAQFVSEETTSLAPEPPAPDTEAGSVPALPDTHT